MHVGNHGSGIPHLEWIQLPWFSATASQRGDTWPKDVSLWTLTYTRQVWDTNTKNKIRVGVGAINCKSHYIVNNYISPWFNNKPHLVGDPAQQRVPALHKELGVPDRYHRLCTFGGDFSFPSGDPYCICIGLLLLLKTKKNEQFRDNLDCNQLHDYTIQMFFFFYNENKKRHKSGWP